jgi:FlaA1/EpsC-like NDP-sugar epimerase
MTQSQAVDLILEAIQLGQGGEIFTHDMPAVHVQELINAYLERYARNKNTDSNTFKINEYTVNQSENAHENLFSSNELPRVRRLEQTLVLFPRDNDTVGEPLTPEFPISSEHCSKLSADEIDSILELANL